MIRHPKLCTHTSFSYIEYVHAYMYVSDYTMRQFSVNQTEKSKYSMELRENRMCAREKHNERFEVLLRNCMAN